MLSSAISPVFFLVFGFVLTIVLQAWFVRRLSHLRGKTRESKDLCDRLHAEATALVETVSEFNRGLESNTTSEQMLEREIEALQSKMAAAAGEGEMASPTETDETDNQVGREPGAGPPAAPGEVQDAATHESSAGAPAVPPETQGAAQGPPPTRATPEHSGDETAQT